MAKNKADTAEPIEQRDVAETALPESVRLASPYGFIDDETGEHRYWQVGQEVTNPEEIKVLVERQAPLE